MIELDTTLWTDMMDHLRKQHAPICRQWFDQLQPISLEGGLLTIHTDNPIRQSYLQRQCRGPFNEAAQFVTGALVAVRFVTGQIDMPKVALGSEVGARPPDSSIARKDVLPASTVGYSGEASSDLEELLLSPDYSFENFVTGPGNDLAYAASTAVANQPGVAYNPLFIHGGVGLGKTHLLQAICQKVLKDDPMRRLCYLSCETFVNQFLDCVQRGHMADFRYRYRHVDLLVIDDIHFLANRDRSQEEFFHTFNSLYQARKQIVLSSDRAPAEIPQLEDRLISRFGSGLVTSVARPDYETRLAIVLSKTRMRGLEMSDDVASFIATRIATNTRELEGAITTLQGHAALQHKPIDMELARLALGDAPVSSGRSRMTLQAVIDTVISYYQVRLIDLQSKKRHKSITEPRQVCMWLARKHTPFSLEEIGGYFGGRDHTTVMHSIRTVDQRLETEPQFAMQIQELEQSLTGVSSEVEGSSVS